MLVIWLVWLPSQDPILTRLWGEYRVAAPDGGSVPAAEPGAVPAVSALEVADPAFGPVRH
jgi:hypothetical protein